MPDDASAVSQEPSGSTSSSSQCRKPVTSGTGRSSRPSPFPPGAPPTSPTPRLFARFRDSRVRRFGPVERSPDLSPRLTDAQHEVLRAADEDGYFEIPRRTTTNELAERFDVSDT